MSATDYDFYVQTDCGGGDVSAWSQMETFLTPCDYFEVPFSEDFEALIIWKCHRAGQASYFVQIHGQPVAKREVTFKWKTEATLTQQ